jgi:hypothetical protein
LSWLLLGLLLVFPSQLGEPGDQEVAEKMFRRKLGFTDATPEQKMAWRKELPEYHKNLVGHCTLLVKPLQLPAKCSGWGWW